MVKIEIDNKAYYIPERLTIEQWAGIASYDVEEMHNWPYIISAITAAPYTSVAQMTEEEQQLVVVLIISKIFALQECRHTDFNEITFGQFIDFEYYIAVGLHKVHQKALNILGCDTQWADEAQYAFQQYLLFRNNLMFQQYAGLFGFEDGSSVDDLEDYEAPTPQQVAKRWYGVIADLAQDDVLKMQSVTELGLKEALNFMAHLKQKRVEENKKIKQQQKQYELQRRR